MDIATATPVQIDTEISRIDWELARTRSRIDADSVLVKRRDDATPYYLRLYPSITEKAAEAELRLPGHYVAILTLQAEVQPLHAEYARRGGWNRYYLVSGGHLHFDVSDYRCSRIATTSHHWVTSVSGLSEAEVVELAGTRVCTVCFPSAPVAVLARPSKLSTPDEDEAAQARSARDEKRAKAAETKAAKAITTPEGSELRIDGWPINTERAAMIKLVDELWYQEFYSRPQDHEEAVMALTEALAHKHGTTAQDELSAAKVRLAARIKREERMR